MADMLGWLEGSGGRVETMIHQGGRGSSNAVLRHEGDATDLPLVERRHQEASHTQTL
jgi:hypothetical protein